MAKLLGIDVSGRVARAILVRTGYRRVVLEGLGEAPIETTEADAVRAAVANLGEGLRAPMSLRGNLMSAPPPVPSPGRAGARADAVAVALPGDRCFYRRLELPRAAQKELQNVLAFELESTVPFEMEGAVHDHRILRRGPTPDLVAVIAAIARMEDVVERVALVNQALGREPEVVGPGALPLATLVSVIPELDPDAMARAALKAKPKAKKTKVAGLPAEALAEAQGAAEAAEPPAEPVKSGPIAIVDLGDTRSEVVFLVSGEPVFVRTISRGTEGLPATAGALARELRQTVAAFRALGQEPPVAMFLSGGGASVQGAEAFLTAELAVPVRRLPAPRIEGVTPDQAARLPHFAKALGLALGVEGGRGMNLRQGALEASRTYPFLREKLPLLSGLAAVIAVSFGFSVVAEMRSLKAERQHLDERLAVVSQEILGQETRDPAQARELLEAGGGADEDDPLPGADAFDVMVQLSKSVPEDVVHDVAEFDVSRGHAIIHGVVPKEADAQKTAETIAEGMRKHACLRDVKIQKVQQFGTDKQKYIMEMDVRCGERKKKTDPKKAGAAGTTTTGAKSDAATEEP